MRTILLSAIGFVALASCSGVKTKTALTPNRAGALSSRTGPVCMLAGGLPDGVNFVEIGRIHATKGTYGERENLMLPILDAAGVNATVGEISDCLRGVFGEHREV